jgi:large conductance mechanosensitive channel
MRKKIKKKSKKVYGEFKTFILKGNVFDLAVGVIIGAAFQGIVNSLVKDMIMPVISIFTGGLDFSQWFIPLDGKTYETLALAQEQGASTLNLGVFLISIINFLILAAVVFAIVKLLGKIIRKKEEEKTTKECPFCKTDIKIEAVKCPHCTSEL